MATAISPDLPGVGKTAPGARRYTRVAIAFHWIIAALILVNLYLGWRMGSAEGLDRFTLFQRHKSVGITVLVLSLLRLGWRLTHSPPAYPATMKGWERAGAHAVHALFYFWMIAMPVTGWIIVSASPLNIPTLLYGTIPLPHLGFVHEQSFAVRALIDARVGTSHVLLAYGFAALIVLHIAAALKHQFVERDSVLPSMWPVRRSARADRTRTAQVQAGR